LNILVYEHITGGGMLDSPEMAALAPEGEMMLRALVDDLAAVLGVEITMLRDFRLADDLPCRTLIVQPGRFDTVFMQALQECDAAWPIAPEQDGVLLAITNEIVSSGRRLLGNRADAIATTSSKRATAFVLAQAGIPMVPVYAKESDIPSEIAELVCKPDDGVGCQNTLLFGDRGKLRDWLRANGNARTIFQPYIRGEARSLSLLCCAGRAHLLACNRQNVTVENGVFRFHGVSVNAVTDSGGRYGALASAIARALPGLWGYCGVDFIETESGPLVLEVNPRLTTSYVGLRRAIGINPAQLVLDLPKSLDDKAIAWNSSCSVEVEIAHAT
jgi:tyramine---L-glutamate ligase